MYLYQLQLVHGLRVYKTATIQVMQNAGCVHRCTIYWVRDYCIRHNITKKTTNDYNLSCPYKESVPQWTCTKYENTRLSAGPNCSVNCRRVIMFDKIITERKYIGTGCMAHKNHCNNKKQYYQWLAQQVLCVMLSNFPTPTTYRQPIDCSLPVCLCPNLKCLHWWWIHTTSITMSHWWAPISMKQLSVHGSSIFCCDDWEGGQLVQVNRTKCPRLQYYQWLLNSVRTMQWLIKQ